MFVSHMLRFASRDSVEKERSIVRALKLPARSMRTYFETKYRRKFIIDRKVL